MLGLFTISVNGFSWHGSFIKGAGSGLGQLKDQNGKLIYSSITFLDAKNV